MDETATDQAGVKAAAAPVFISYATANRAAAHKACAAIEKRGIPCWISTRDVSPGANYQEAIVQALRGARALVLVFSAAANSSDEIKKELSLASRFRLPVIALRIEDVEPSDAFAYELSTRQWIDAFEGWEPAIDAVARRIADLSGADDPVLAAPMPARTRRVRARWIAIAAALVALVAVGAWWALRPPAAAAHPLSVRLAGFKLLSDDLSASLPDAVNEEITAAFNADGVVGVLNADAPPTGKAPAYALSGTIRRDDQRIRVISKLVNERSGATLWTGDFDYDRDEAPRILRHIAVDAGNVVRCGLFGASTYRKPLPDAVMQDYLSFCEGHWNPSMMEGRKALVPAQRTVAAVPDFSWGWAAVAGAYWKVAASAESDALAAKARADGRAAADRAIAIDPRNSEAYYIKAVLLDRTDWTGKEALYKQAVGARRLDCGCEHHQYGWMLLNVGRIAEAIEQLRQANDMLSLYVYTPLTLADGLVIAGKPEEAKTYYDAAIDLAPNKGFADSLRFSKALETMDASLLADPSLDVPPAEKAALLDAIRSSRSNDAAAKARAARGLLALPANQQDSTSVALLLALGARGEAFAIAQRIATQQEYPGPSFLWNPRMRALLDDPRFPALAKQLQLINYWKATRTRPDVCTATPSPAFCRMI